MHELYYFRPPSANAEPPARWSYTALAAWRECPRRWWLLNSHYPNTPTGTYPVPYGRAALQGRLVHAALEAYAKFRRETRTSEATDPAPHFNARLFLKRALRDILTAEVETNPRLDTGALYAGVSLDECLSLFYEITEKIPSPPAATRGAAPPAAGARPPTDAEELWIEVEDPPLGGRIDRAHEGCLIDFKTGEPSESHAAQLVFYAVLWWLKFGEPPKHLQLHYPSSNVPQDVSVPLTAELSALTETYRREVDQANATLRRGTPPARPGTQKCERCPVRQLCDDYWADCTTRPLRSSDQVTDGTLEYRDVRLCTLPANWAPGQSLRGPATAEILGEVSAAIPGAKCPSDTTVIPVGARLLGARIFRKESRWEITAASSCEVFWEL
jgi:hypothetical protein